ncbi:MAG TPA: phage tail protein [Azospirillum sp.]|nr:phage tail protein [Azospirillum sp.]
MSDLTLTIKLTDAGMAAVAAAHGQGIQAKITAVAVGDQGYVPTADATALRNELARVELTAGGAVAPQQVLLQGMIPPGETEFFIRELGYYLEDGTLLGVWSDPATPLGWIGGATPWFFKLAFAWTALPDDAITVLIADDGGQAGMALDLAQLDGKVRHTVETGGLVWAATDNTLLTAAIQAIAAISGFTTGDVKLTLKPFADAGWVLANDGTIGSAASGATTRANADTQALYTLLWNHVAEAWAPVTGGRGASAAADFAANKPLKLTRMLGRALAIAGGGAGLSVRALGQFVGAETHTLTTNELASHQHNTWPGNTPSGGGGQVAEGAGAPFDAPAPTEATGGGGAHNNMQPTVFLNAMIKL